MIQAKLGVGPAGDRYEQEADRVAAAVMRNIRRQPTSAEPAPFGTERTARVQPMQRGDARDQAESGPGRDDACGVNGVGARVRATAAMRTVRPADGVRDLPLVAQVQAKMDTPMIGAAGGELDADTNSRIQRARGSGAELDPGLRQSMEGAFGADFSGVRVHHGDEANALSHRIQARAFTTGSDIFFRDGEYHPSSRSGQELLAHELTHTIQQGGSVQRSASARQNVTPGHLGTFLSGPQVVQRTIDQDARFWALDWLATWKRPFPTMARKFGLPKLIGICTGTIDGTTQDSRATYTTALATGLVRMGAEKAGQLSARLVDEKKQLLELMQELEKEIPDDIPALLLATDDTREEFERLKGEISDPFLVLKSGGATFTFSREMALHMMRRHHPKYLSGPPMQVQSYFDEETTIKNIEAIITGTINQSEKEIKAWRALRMKKTTDLASAEATTLNLRPFWDGNHWELTLTINSSNRQEGKGVVAHFTPTL